MTVTENGVRVRPVSVARQGTAEQQLGGRARDRRVADDEGQADRQTRSRRPARSRAQANPDEQIAVVTFNGKRQRRAAASRPARGDRPRALRDPPARRTGRRSTTRSTSALGLLTDANVTSGSIVLLTDGQNVGSVAKPAAVMKELRRSARPGLLGRARLAGVQTGPACRTLPRRPAAPIVEATGPSQLSPIFARARPAALERVPARLPLAREPGHAGRGQGLREGLRRIGGDRVHDAAAAPGREAAPYHPAVIDRFVQSRYTMFAVVLVLAGLVGFAVSFVARSRTDPLVERVGDFVSVQQAGAIRSRTKERKPLITRRPGFLSGSRQADAAPNIFERIGRGTRARRHRSRPDPARGADRPRSRS